MILRSELEKKRRELNGLVKDKDVSCDDFCIAVERELLKKVRESILSMKELAKKHLVNSPEKIEEKRQQISSAVEEMQTTLYEFDSYTCTDILEFTDDNWRTSYYGKDFTSSPVIDDLVQRIILETQANLEDSIRKVFQETYNIFFPERVGRGNHTIKTMQLREVNIGVDFLMDIVCASKDVMICSAQNNCSLFRIECGMKSVVPCTGFNPEYISMSASSDILFFTSLNELFKLSMDNMEIVEFFKLDSDWEFNGLTLAAYDRVYLCLKQKTLGKGWILCLNIYGEVVDEYFLNNDGHALFVNPIYISENKNNDGDICVSDNYSEVCSIKQNKEIRFVYKGVEKMELDFRGIVSDVLGNVLVSDFRNNLIHVINKRGKLIRKIGEDFLCKPTGICIDPQGVIWVTEYEGGRVKMIEA
ncbi:uncharacterized protein LOC133203396 [Saccostrea echinata]|uniref:uncharacterized protein LOC133203396 n=1 Tax=Saccostrea echinata TaxID=191078 RepID=UPI002A7EFAE6|nr:uncharacterized protein LOC133203396 [Saccostrea echinata]